MKTDGGQYRNGEVRPDPGTAKVNSLDSPMPNKEILLFDQIENDPAENMKNGTESGSYVRGQPSIAAGWRRWNRVRHMVRIDFGAIGGVGKLKSRFRVLRANPGANFRALC